MKQVELANRLGISRAYMSMLINGKRTPSKQLTKKLQKLTGEANILNGVQVVAGSNPATPTKKWKPLFLTAGE